jgi:hypothetical protein
MLGLSPNRLPQNPVLFHHAPHYLSHFPIYLSMHNFESYTYRYLHTVQIYGIRVHIYYIMLYYIILCYIILYYIRLDYIIVYYTILDYVIVYCTIA